MITNEQVASFQEIIQASKSFLILLRSQPTFDQVSSALSLYLTLQSLKKEVDIACPEPMRVEFGNLVGVEQVKNEIGNHILRITFDYSEESVENVNYEEDKENGKFHLLIRPQRGHRPLDPTTVEYSNVGVDAEAIIMIGVSDYSQLTPFYEQEENAFTQAHTISINKNPASIAAVNLDMGEKGTMCELMYKMLAQLGWEVSADVASNLLAGIELTTDSFRHYAVNAETFAAVAELMRAGGRRMKVAAVSPAQAQQTNQLAAAFAKQQHHPVQQVAQSSVPVAPQVATESATPQIQQLKRIDPATPGGMSYTPPVR